MSVLARDVDAYNRALAAYQRKAAGYNRVADVYRQSITQDASGNPYLYRGDYDPLGPNNGQYYTYDQTAQKTNPVDKPAGYAGMTAIEGNPGYSLVRQNPTSKETKTLANVYKGGGGFDEDGNKKPEYFFTRDGDNQRVIDASKVRVLDQKEGVDQPGSGGGDGPDRTPTTYTIEYDENSFADRPPDWNETFDKKAPDPTKAQIRQASRLSLAQQEAGLVGEVIRAGGLKTGSGGLIKSQMEAPATAAATGLTPEQRAAAEYQRLQLAGDR